MEQFSFYGLKGTVRGYGAMHIATHSYRLQECGPLAVHCVRLGDLYRNGRILAVKSRALNARISLDNMKDSWPA